MNYPPMIMRLKVQKQGRGINLWMPLFIIGPIFAIFALAFSLVLLPFCLLVAIIFWRPRMLKRLFFFWAAAFILTGAMRGLQVDIKKGPDVV